MNLKSMMLGALCALSAFVPEDTLASTHQGFAHRCTDGDTCTVTYNGITTRVRLAEIDAPESDQAFGRVSGKALSSMVVGRKITITTNETDRYGRPIVEMTVNGVSVNQEQVRRGYAWVNTRYSRDPKLRLLQLRAQMTRAGLWADPSPVPPWDWRRRTKR